MQKTIKQISISILLFNLITTLFLITRISKTPKPKYHCKEELELTKTNNDYQQVPILQYHHFLPKEELDKHPEEINYAITLELFEEEMKYLYDNGYRSLTIKEFEDWKEGKISIPQKSVVITIDDGLKSALYYAEPILKKYKMHAILFTITNRVTETSQEINNDPLFRTYVSKEEIKNNDGSTIEFGSHTHAMHKSVHKIPLLKSSSKEEIINDLNTSYDIIKTNIMSYPYSYTNNKIIDAIKETNFKYAMTGDNKKTYRLQDNYQISRIGLVAPMETFKEIFETNKYNQKNINKYVSSKKDNNM